MRSGPVSGRIPERGLPADAVSWVITVFGRTGHITRARRLRPGSWHINHAIDVIDNRGRKHRVVPRRWARPGWQDDDPDYTVERELRVLDLLHRSPVPIPEVIAADLTGAHCDVPALLLTHLPGHSPTTADIVAKTAAGSWPPHWLRSTRVSRQHRPS